MIHKIQMVKYPKTDTLNPKRNDLSKYKKINNKTILGRIKALLSLN